MNARILLVDDDPGLSEVVELLLTREGYAVARAGTVKDCLERVRRTRLDLVIADLKLPDGTGLKLIPTLLRLDPHTRIIVLTGYGSIATAIDAIKLGATYYLTKPVDADDLVYAFDRAGDANTPPNERPMSLQRVTWEHIDRVLQEHNGNISATARALSMHRRTLQRKLSKRPVRY